MFELACVAGRSPHCWQQVKQSGSTTIFLVLNINISLSRTAGPLLLLRQYYKTTWIVLLSHRQRQILSTLALYPSLSVNIFNHSFISFIFLTFSNLI